MDSNLYEIIVTDEDLKKCVKDGLIPAELLDPTKEKELFEFVTTHMKIIQEDFKNTSSDDGRYVVVDAPTADKWHMHPDIVVLDKLTGEKRVMEMAAPFDLCDGVQLTIKAKELPQWHEETSVAKKLNAEQSKHLAQFVSKLSKKRELTRKDIVTFIEEIRKPKKVPKYRQSGHLVDQKLKYRPCIQPSLFDQLMPETRREIEESKVEVTAEGIKLTQSQSKMVHALNKLLHQKSQHVNPKAEDFYTGNEPIQIAPYGKPDMKSSAPVIRFRPAELYRAYLDSNEYSGGDIKHINNTLMELASKRFLIKYDRIKKVKDGTKTKELTDRIEDFQSLIKIISFIPDLTTEEKNSLDTGDNSVRESKGEIIVALNPIFRDQIDTKFIEFPEDINRRLVIAAGGFNMVSASMQILMEWVLRELSAKREKCEINNDKMPYILGLEKYVKNRMQKKLQDRINKDVDAIVNLGLITKYEFIPNKIGGMKWVFYLNKNYE